jgi:hypothetical protein
MVFFSPILPDIRCSHFIAPVNPWSEPHEATRKTHVRPDAQRRCQTSKASTRWQAGTTETEKSHNPVK